MQRQGSFSQAEYAGKKKQTRRDRFLAKSGKPIGRARITADNEQAIRVGLASGKGVLKVAREARTGSSTVQRIKREMAVAKATSAV